MATRQECMYRGKNGRKCAAGHLIPDSRYRVGLEGKTVMAGQVYDILVSEGYDPNFVVALQCMHDSSILRVDVGTGRFQSCRLDPDDASFLQTFRERALKFAAEFGLSAENVPEPPEINQAPKRSGSCEPNDTGLPS